MEAEPGVQAAFSSFKRMKGGKGEGIYASSMSADIGIHQTDQGLTLPPKIKSGDGLYFDDDSLLAEDSFEDALKQIQPISRDHSDDDSSCDVYHLFNGTHPTKKRRLSRVSCEALTPQKNDFQSIIGSRPKSSSTYYSDSSIIDEHSQEHYHEDGNASVTAEEPPLDSTGTESEQVIIHQEYLDREVTQSHEAQELGEGNDSRAHIFVQSSNLSVEDRETHCTTDMACRIDVGEAQNMFRASRPHPTTNIIRTTSPQNRPEHSISSKDSLQTLQSTTQSQQQTPVTTFRSRTVQQPTVDKSTRSSLSKHLIPAELQLRFDALLKKFRTDEQFRKSVQAYLAEMTVDDFAVNDGDDEDHYNTQDLQQDFYQKDLTGLTPAEIAAAFRNLETLVVSVQAKLSRSQRNTKKWRDLSNYYKNLAHGTSQKSQKPDSSIPIKGSWTCTDTATNGNGCGMLNPYYVKQAIWVRKEDCTLCGAKIAKSKNLGVITSNELTDDGYSPPPKRPRTSEPVTAAPALTRANPPFPNPQAGFNLRPGSLPQYGPGFNPVSGPRSQVASAQKVAFSQMNALVQSDASHLSPQLYQRTELRPPSGTSMNQFLAERSQVNYQSPYLHLNHSAPMDPRVSSVTATSQDPVVSSTSQSSSRQGGRIDLTKSPSPVPATELHVREQVMAERVVKQTGQNSVALRRRPTSKVVKTKFTPKKAAPKKVFSPKKLTAVEERTLTATNDTLVLFSAGPRRKSWERPLKVAPTKEIIEITSDAEDEFSAPDSLLSTPDDLFSTTDEPFSNNGDPISTVDDLFEDPGDYFNDNDWAGESGDVATVQEYADGTLESEFYAEFALLEAEEAPQEYGVGTLESGFYAESTPLEAEEADQDSKERSQGGDDERTGDPEIEMKTGDDESNCEPRSEVQIMAAEESEESEEE